MRCSKCGYISFDHLESCRKCHKPMADAALMGTTFAVAVPLFLQLSPEEDAGEFVEDLADILDPDLELFADVADEVIDFEGGRADNQGIAITDGGQSSGGEITLDDDLEIAFDSDSKDADLSLDEEDLFLDTSRFEDVPVNVQAAQTAAHPVQFEIPEGLADISDLARPVAAAEAKSGLDAGLDYDDLNLDDLDLSFGGDKASDSDFSAEEDGLADLSLDEIDLSDGLEVVPPQSSSHPDDDDLDFDLELDAFGAVNRGSRKKDPDDLPDITLTLE